MAFGFNSRIEATAFGNQCDVSIVVEKVRGDKARLKVMHAGKVMEHLTMQVCECADLSLPRQLNSLCKPKWMFFGEGMRRHMAVGVPKGAKVQAVYARGGTSKVEDDANLRLPGGFIVVVDMPDGSREEAWVDLPQLPPRLRPVEMRPPQLLSFMRKSA